MKLERTKSVPVFWATVYISLRKRPKEL